MLVLLGLRLRYGAPSLPADLPERMKLAAKGSHYVLYALMIGMPLLGWGLLSAAAYPIVLLRGSHLAAILPTQSDSLHTLLWDERFHLAFAFFALILFACRGSIISCTRSTRWLVRNNGLRSGRRWTTARRARSRAGAEEPPIEGTCGLTDVPYRLQADFSA